MKKQSGKRSLATTENIKPMPEAHETTVLLEEIRSLIESARRRAATAINTEMVMLYWHIGERIRRDTLGQERADYGKRIVQALSEKLTIEYGRGFTRTNLFNMIRFAEVFPGREIVHALSGQLSCCSLRAAGYGLLSTLPNCHRAGCLRLNCMKQSVLRGSRSQPARFQGWRREDDI
jgi:hypothetical protein